MSSPEVAAYEAFEGDETQKFQCLLNLRAIQFARGEFYKFIEECNEKSVARQLRDSELLTSSTSFKADHAVSGELSFKPVSYGMCSLCRSLHSSDVACKPRDEEMDAKIAEVEKQPVIGDTLTLPSTYKCSHCEEEHPFNEGCIPCGEDPQPIAGLCPECGYVHLIPGPCPRLP